MQKNVSASGLKAFRLSHASKFHFLKEMYYNIPYCFFSGSSFAPFNTTIILTYRCDLRCKTCFYYSENDASSTLSAIKSLGKELSLEEIKNFIDELAQIKVSVLTLRGGEPLIRKDFFEIAEYAISKGMLVDFASNGTLLTREATKKIVGLGIQHITFSLDGPKDVHDSVRGTKGTFERMLKGIAFIEEEKKTCSLQHPMLSIATTISSANYKHLDKIIEIASQIGIKDVSFVLSTHSSKKAIEETRKTLGVASKREKEGSLLLPEEITLIPPRELKEKRKLVKEKAEALGINAFFPSVEAIEKYPDPKFNELDKCDFPWDRAVISPYGEVFPCVNLGTLPCSFGSIREKSFSEIWDSARFRAFRRILKKKGLLPACSKCCAISPGT